MTDLAIVNGLWSARATAPLVVADLEKARRLLGLDTKHLAKSHRAVSATLAEGTWRRWAPRLRPPARREIEKLLSGGGELWRDEWKNLVVDAGCNHLLDVTLSAGSQITAWYILLGVNNTPPGLTVVAGDTIASQTNWSEVTAYTGSRPSWSDGGVSNKSVDNSPGAEFTMSGSATVGGAGICSVASGTSGTLYAAGAFSSDKTLSTNDTLTVTCTYTMGTP